ncbi:MULTISPECIES: hypothetical protein [Methylobacterium]|uniref:hypothetical protein n=1 Tax=Methylobacterium TaxID=407 RepID=UPI000377232C|nr:MULTISPECIES: hypothetical protein [Methylobacterium]MBN4097394.1 hypothetical protein [Methylobacterium sp. OT2]UIN35629.1 hypothetical protein LXM90_03795 [Methylobacterium oryzae]SFD86076.1 hypothetical protein SAMN02799627_01886 [Methylobacterium sp. 13MFTsu3.1M2]
MSEAILARDQRTEWLPRSRLGLLIFVPGALLWISIVLCMLPITVLAFPAEWMFKNRPNLHATAVMILVCLGAANVVIAPATVLYLLYA